MKTRSASAMICLVMLAGSVSPLEHSAQAIPGRDQWSEKCNSPGAKLTYKEIGRTPIQDSTAITYNLFASGLPKDGHYVLCVLNVGSDPRATTDAYLNEEGKVVSILADPEHRTAEDPINPKVFGGKGGTDIETGPYYVGMSVRVTGLQPHEDFLIVTNSENEGAQI